MKTLNEMTAEELLQTPFIPHTIGYIIALRDNLQSAIDAANKHMIKPNMRAVEAVADDFDALAAYMGETANIMYTTVYTDYLALKARYNAKRSK